MSWYIKRQERDWLLCLTPWLHWGFKVPWFLECKFRGVKHRCLETFDLWVISILLVFNKGYMIMIDYANNHVQEQDFLEARYILTSNIRRTGMFVICMSRHLHDAVFQLPCEFGLMPVKELNCFPTCLPPDLISLVLSSAKPQSAAQLSFTTWRSANEKMWIECSL